MKAQTNELAPFQHTYLALVSDADLVSQLKERLNAIKEVWSKIPIEKHDYAYAPDKWNIKQMLGHMIDTERILAYRALCMARGEQQSLPGFDEDSYVNNAHFQNNNFTELLEEFELVRKSNIKMIEKFTEEDLLKKGIANGFENTVRGLVCVIIGHEMHHNNILNERYLISYNG